MLWSAFGSLGMNRQQSFAKLSNHELTIDKLREHNDVDGNIARFCIAKYMHETYSPLPRLQ